MSTELAHHQEGLIESLVEILTSLLPNDEAERWFHTRHLRLDGCRPCDLILAGRGHLAVELAVHQARQATDATGPPPAVVAEPCRAGGHGRSSNRRRHLPARSRSRQNRAQ